MANISVIVPIYNVEPYLRRCIDSILAQTYTDFELILVDDGSPDNCGKICDEYAAKDKRIHVIHQANGGLSAARNAGIDWAISHPESTYLCFVDSDDWIDTQCIEELAKGVTRSAGIACARHRHVTQNGSYSFGASDRGWQSISTEEYWITPSNLAVSTGAKLIARNLFENIRFPEGKVFEDGATMHRILFQVKFVAYRGIPLYNYYHRNNSITGSEWSTTSLDCIDAIKTQCDFFSKHDYPKALISARGRLYSTMINAAINLEAQGIDLAKAKEFRRFVEAENGNSRVPFWENRDLYRNLEPRFFKVKWLVAMLLDVLKHGRSSWLVQDGIATIKQALFKPTT